MEWSTESIEKVICFVQERPFFTPRVLRS